MKRCIVGTAGHIDHGKTSLIEALTGIDCDRWQEEKDRGITIDLGFAHLEADDLQIGVVDVPGHERFLHNALAGLGGIRIMLLVIAADEGVKPQTREHLDICSLLEIPTGMVVLTKTDLVDGELVDLAELEAEELLEGTPFEGAPIFRCSTVTGDGVDALREALIERALQAALPDDETRPARLPVDRAFHLKGLGVIVTGTLVSGSIEAGDTLEIAPNGASARVRSIQVHGEPRETAHVGERTSLQLTGPTLADLERGVQLVTDESLVISHRLVGRYTHLPNAPISLTGWTPVRLHLLTHAVSGKARPLEPAAFEPGTSGTIEIRLDRRIATVRGDRFVLRRLSPVETLGGGVVLDPAWHRRRPADRAAAVTAVAGDDRAALTLWISESAEGGVTAEELARRSGRDVAAVTELLEAAARDGKLLTAVTSGTRRWFDPNALKRAAERAKRVLRDYFDRDRLATGMPKAEAVRRILRGRGRRLADVFLPWLEAQGVLTVVDREITLPGRRVALSNEESGLAGALLAAFDRHGLTPPSPAEICREVDGKPQICDGLIEYLTKQGKLVRLPGGLLVASAAIDRLADELRATGWERFGVPMFKDRFGLSRKWTIPLLEHLDSIGVTRRAGDERLIARP